MGSLSRRLERLEAKANEQSPLLVSGTTIDDCRKKLANMIEPQGRVVYLIATGVPKQNSDVC